MPTGTLKPRPAPASPSDSASAKWKPKSGLTAPVAASADVPVSGVATRVGTLPVAVSAVAAVQDDALVPGRKVPDAPAVVPGPSRVRVEVTDPAAASVLGVTGAVLALTRSDLKTGPGRVHLSVDATSFADASGGDFVNRLRLVALPACALTTPQVRACQTRTELGSTNRLGVVSADVSVAGDPAVTSKQSAAAASTTVVALTSSSSSAGVSFEATSLSPAYGWSAGAQGGGFSYRYPMKVPAGLGGPTPNLALTYDSGLVDGQTLAANGQTSWVGQGWDLQVGYVERSYRSCPDKDGAPQIPGQCWFSNNATMVFEGRSTDLVRDDSSGVWHPADDSGLKVEDLTGASNGLYNGEYWRVTTQDGTQYYFGRAKRYSGDPADSASALGEPVFATRAGEPCYTGSFGSSWCRQGYRWNLDYVVDPRGNSMTYFYAKMVGHVGINNNASVQPYDMSAVLIRAEYGTRAGVEGSSNAPVRVLFNVADRCFPGNPTPCDQHVHWPDTPWDLACSSGATCPNTLAPVYFTASRLTQVVTQVWGSSGYRNVDEYNLGQTFLSAPDNGSNPDLWLETVRHYGYAPDGSNMSEPQMAVGGTAFANRKDFGPDLGVSGYYHYRVTAIDNGVGGRVYVDYNNAECTRSLTPTPDNNPYRCFPQYFKPQQAAAGWGWFQKYTMAKVTQWDLTNASPNEVWDYTYSTANSSSNVLWHHNMAETVSLDYRSWSTWRGYSTVTVTHGTAGGPREVTTTVYYRGMDLDRTSAGGWNSRRVNLTVPAGVPNVTAPVTLLGKCIDNTAGVTTNGNKIEIWDGHGGVNQQLTLTLWANLMVQGKCLQAAAPDSSGVSWIQLWDCLDIEQQKWALRQDGRLINPISGLCLDLPYANTTNGTQLALSSCSGTAQNWLSVITDTDALAGQAFESRSMDGSITANAATHEYAVTQTASRAPVNPPDNPTVTAQMVTETTTVGRTWLALTNGWQWDVTQTRYDSYGDVTDVTDIGDPFHADDVCTHTDYTARDTTRWMVNYPEQVYSTNCASPPANSDFLTGTQYYYDATNWGAAPTAGLLTKTMALVQATGSPWTWASHSRTEYDTNGRITATYDALNNKTSTAYTPASGGPVTQAVVTNPAGWTTTTTIEPGHGTPLTVTDFNGKITTAQYDQLGRLVKAWGNNRPTTATPDVQHTYTLTWNSAWVQTLTLGPNGTQVPAYQIYDGFLRPRQTQTPTTTDTGGRLITDTGYDERGHVAKTTMFYNSSPPTSSLATFADTDVPNQHRYTFDNLGRQTVDALWSTNSLVLQTSTAYDGDRTTVTPPAGGTATRALIDGRGNIRELDQYLGSTPGGPYQATTYGYDRLGRQTSMTDPVGNTWTTTYDLRGRVTAKSDPDAGTTTMTYDDAGQLLTTTDARTVMLTNVYDNLGRRTAEWQGAAGTGTKLLDFTYDTIAKGQLTSANRYSGGGTYTTAVTGYDDAYRPLGTTVTIPASEGFSPNSWTMSQTYNVNGSVATTTLPAAGGLGQETVTTGYDSTGAPLSLTGLDTYIASTAYYSWGDVQQRILGAAGKRVRIATNIDEATRRLTTAQTQTEDQASPGSWLEALTESYGYDPAGNVTAIAETSGGSMVSNQCFGYDALRRLVEAWTTTATACQASPSQAVVGGPDPYWTSYRYTSVGNRSQQISHATGGDVTRTYSYPAAGSPQPHAVTSVVASGAATGTDSYGYDQAGNTTTRNRAGQPAQTLTWDPEGHLATVTDTAGTTSYIYDATGNRLIAKDNTGETVYLGPTEIHRDQLGSATATRFYPTAVRTTTGGLVWQIGDHHATAQLSINPTTLAVTRRKTDPFGNPRGLQPAWPTNHGFVNGTSDPTGLTHLGAREYDPAIGRFTSVDPVFDLGDPQSWQGYAYADNTPVTSSDPSGLRIAGCEETHTNCRTGQLLTSIVPPGSQHLPAPPPKHRKLVKNTNNAGLWGQIWSGVGTGTVIFVDSTINGITQPFNDAYDAYQSSDNFLGGLAKAYAVFQADVVIGTVTAPVGIAQSQINLYQAIANGDWQGAATAATVLSWTAAAAVATEAVGGLALGRIAGGLGRGAGRAAAETGSSALRGVDEVLGGLSRGKQGFVRTVPDEASLNSTFTELTQGGSPTTWKNFGGTVIERGDGVQVGLRTYSKSGGPTIDIRMPDGTFYRIHVGQ